MKVYVNPFVRDMTRIFPPQGRYGKLRYDMNENPEGLPKEFVDSVLKEITPEFLSIYPEPDRFLVKYADFVGVKLENLVCTNGSDQAIRYVLETFGEVGKEVVTVAPSFEMYWVNCMLLGYKHIPVAYESDMTIDVKKIVAAINDNTRVVVLLNPNNPVGNVYSDEEFHAVQARADEVGAVVIVDEAYHYFYSKTFLQEAVSMPNVIVLRTFSKLMSLAACRLGVVIANPQIAHYVRNNRLTFDANSIALLFAERLIERPDIVQDLVRIQQEGKDFCLAECRKYGYWCKDCMGNFIFIKPNHDAHEVAERLEHESAILVHPYGNPMLKDLIRVSTGSRKAMEKFIDAFLKVDAK